ncbi:MAG TPA: hypothetical protein VKA46_12050 [Gemmataceae bacterium]|nr:hypothetical protein [Gemmataceae bacterium]
MLAMQLQPQQVLQLVSGRATTMGHVVVERVQEGVVFAHFVPGPGYPDVKPLFDEFEGAVNQQLFTVADEAGVAIASLGLCLRAADGQDCVPAYDVQIMNGHDLSCRLAPLAAPAAAPGDD